MPISDFTNTVPKQYVQITTIDTLSRTIQGRLKDGTIVLISAYNTPPFFRWPRENEIWSINYGSNGWMLGDFIEQEEPQSPIEDLLPGEGRIDADRLVIGGNLDVGGYLKLDGHEVVTAPMLDDLVGDINNLSLELDSVSTTLGTQSGLIATLNGEFNALDSNLTLHTLATTDVHGIADTSRLITIDNIGSYASSPDLTGYVKADGSVPFTGYITGVGLYLSDVAGGYVDTSADSNGAYFAGGDGLGADGELKFTTDGSFLRLQDIRLRRTSTRSLTIDDLSGNNLLTVASNGVVESYGGLKGSFVQSRDGLFYLGSDVRLTRTAAKTLTLDDGADGAAELHMGYARLRAPINGARPFYIALGDGVVGSSGNAISFQSPDGNITDFHFHTGGIERILRHETRGFYSVITPGASGNVNELQSPPLAFDGNTVAAIAQAANKPAMITRAAPSHTTNIEEWQGSDQAVLAKISASGNLTAKQLVIGSYFDSFDFGGLYGTNADSSTRRILYYDHNSHGLVLGDADGNTNVGMSAPRFWPSFSSGDGFIARFASDGRVDRLAIKGHSQGGSTTVWPSAATAIPLIVQGLYSQTADLQQWQGPDGTAWASVGRFGGATFISSLDQFSTTPALRLNYGHSGSGANTMEAYDHASVLSMRLNRDGELYAKAGFRAGPGAGFAADLVSSATNYNLRLDPQGTAGGVIIGQDASGGGGIAAALMVVSKQFNFPAMHVKGVPTAQGAHTADLIDGWRQADDNNPVFRVSASGVVDGTGYTVAGTALASTHLSDSTQLSRVGHTHTSSDITGLDTALAAKADLVGGVVPTSQIPAIATNVTMTVASQAAMLALTSTQVQPGDIAIRSDLGRRFLLAEPNPSVLANWIPLETPDSVTSVNGQQGTVVLASSDVGAAPTSHTHAIADTTGLQTALDAKAPVNDPHLTGVPTAPTAAVDTDTDQVATTAYVINQGYVKTSSGIADRTYHYVQSVASLTWTITHNLGKYPTPIFFDHTGDEIMPGTISFPSNNVIIATFSVETAGDAYIN